MTDDPTRREYHQNWRDENREYCRALTRDWKERNRQSYNLKEKENAARRREKRRLVAIGSLGGKCVRCGFTDERALQFDHKTPLRRKTNNLPRGGTLKPREFAAIVGGTAHDLQLLCANCHAIKTKSEDDLYNRGG